LFTAVKILVARHTNFGLIVNPPVQAALTSVLSDANKVYTGGDMDSLTDPSNYWDGTHLTATGADNAANIAVAAITAHAA
jgi:lysophospholipase L1-like esterase